MIPVEPLTLKDVYDKISETKTLLEVQAFQVKALLESDGDHETRLRLLERWRYAIPSTLLLVNDVPRISHDGSTPVSVSR